MKVHTLYSFALYRGEFFFTEVERHTQRQLSDDSSRNSGYKIQTKAELLGLNVEPLEKKTLFNWLIHVYTDTKLIIISKDNQKTTSGKQQLLALK